MEPFLIVSTPFLYQGKLSVVWSLVVWCWTLLTPKHTNRLYANSLWSHYTYTMIQMTTGLSLMTNLIMTKCYTASSLQLPTKFSSSFLSTHYSTPSLYTHTPRNIYKCTQKNNWISHQEVQQWPLPRLDNHLVYCTCTQKRNHVQLRSKFSTVSPAIACFLAFHSVSWYPRCGSDLPCCLPGKSVPHI